MMRPKSIILFERLFIGSLILGALNSVLDWNNGLDKLAANPSTASFGMGFMIFILLSVWVISFLFWYSIARLASNVAKWVFVVLFGLGLLIPPYTIPQNPTLVTVVTLIMFAMQAVSIFVLFRPDAKEWFETKGKMDDMEKTFE